MCNENKSLLAILSKVPDTRQQAKVMHSLVDILFISIVATIAGADDWQCIEDFVEAKADWFRKFIPLANGVPSHDTIERVFKQIDPKIFLQCFMEWTQLIAEIVQKGVIAIDGKTMRGSYDSVNGKKALHMVSAWFSETGITYGQVKTAEKSNEITAIPELIDLLDLTGQIVTTDAMGTQKDIAAKIIGKKGDYVLALKGNHPLLYAEVEQFFAEVEDPEFRKLYSVNTCTKKEKGHGRIEYREYYITSLLKWLDARKEWKNLTSIGMVVYHSEKNGVKTTETRYFLCSIEAGPEKFAYAARQHWGIESMHWSLDVTFNEDSKRVRKENAPENLALLHKFAFNVLKMEKTRKRSLKAKRFKASLSLDYLEKVLNCLTN
jgi:predicted transposase YbfD/YdcC